MLGSGDGTEDRGLLAIVGETLAGEVGSASLGDLDDDRGLVVTGSLENRVGSGGGGDVLSRIVRRISG